MIPRLTTAKANNVPIFVSSAKRPREMNPENSAMMMPASQVPAAGVWLLPLILEKTGDNRPSRDIE
ncbi:hypothetical protein D1872_354670 [compost metagenome]